MSGHHERKPTGRRMPVCFLALSLLVAGMSFPAGSGQTQNRSEIAEIISGKKKIRLVTPLGELICRDPILLTAGIGCRKDGSDGATGEATVPWDDILAVKVRRSGVGLGVLSGFLAGAGLGFWGTRGIVDEADGGDYFRPMAILGGMGALAGGLIGALASSWKTVYTAQTGPAPLPTVSLAPARRGGMAISLSLSF